MSLVEDFFKKLIAEMFFGESFARMRFQIFFKIKRLNFVRKSKIILKLPRFIF